MNSVATGLAPRPWYRQLWPWLLISMPLTAVLAGAVTWYLAWASNDGLVAEDYYKQGLAINRSLASQELARQLGLQAVLQQQGDELRLSLGSERELSLAPSLRLRILSPVRAGQDRTLELALQGRSYMARLAGLADGHWNLVLEDSGATWQLRGSGQFPLAAEVELKP